jgi:hypothetical protein
VRKFIGAAVIAMLILYIACYLVLLQVPVSEVFLEKGGEVVNESITPGDSSLYGEKEKLVLSFIRENMLGMNGEVFTNLRLDSGGMYTLSESAGLLLDYCARRGDKELFEKEYTYLKSSLLQEGHFIRWKSEPSGISCNAVIDDLRIVRALLRAYELWGMEEYKETAWAIQKALFEKQTLDGGLTEFYDWGQKAASKRIPLCYLDLYTMNLLKEMDTGWGDLTAQSLALLKKGRSSAASPVFFKYYDYKRRSYTRDEEYGKSKSICLTYTIYTALHLAEVREDTSFFADWLEKELEGKGKLCAWYNPVTMKPVNGMESTAVYALAAVYAKTAGKQELYGSLVDKMLGFMVTEPNSRYYGGFGTVETGEFFSFDNLTALWALSLEEAD